MIDAAGALIERALQALDQAAALGDHGAGDAAKVLRGIRRLGRPVEDDTEALREVRRLRDCGNRSAIAVVAQRLGRTATEIEAIARRLRRKEKDGRKL
jgi:hypothetical protein